MNSIFQFFFKYKFSSKYISYNYIYTMENESNLNSYHLVYNFNFINQNKNYSLKKKKIIYILNITNTFKS